MPKITSFIANLKNLPFEIPSKAALLDQHAHASTLLKFHEYGSFNIDLMSYAGSYSADVLQEARTNNLTCSVLLEDGNIKCVTPTFYDLPYTLIIDKSGLKVNLAINKEQPYVASRDTSNYIEIKELLEAAIANERPLGFCSQDGTSLLGVNYISDPSEEKDWKEFGTANFIKDRKPLPGTPTGKRPEDFALVDIKDAKNLDELSEGDKEYLRRFFAILKSRSFDPERSFYDNLSITYIPFRFPDDGCMVRAEAVCKLLADDMKDGSVAPCFSIKKLWICDSDVADGDNIKLKTRNTPDGYITWDYHVSAALAFTTGAEEVYAILDPSIYEDGPISSVQWFNLFEVLKGTASVYVSDSSLYWWKRTQNKEEFYLTNSETSSKFIPQLLWCYNVYFRHAVRVRNGPPPYPAKNLA